MTLGADLMTDAMGRARCVSLRFLLGLLILCCWSASAQDQTRATERTLNQAAMGELLEELRSDPRRDLHGVIVLLDGSVVSETYFNGSNADTLHDVRSVGKSITSLLVGIALDKGLIRSVDESVYGLLTGARDTARAKITLQDVLTMRSGLAATDGDPDSPGRESLLDASSDWLAFASAVPLREPPGQRYTYASLNAFLAGAVVERASGRTLSDFAKENLFGPLGISQFRWRRGPKGEGCGQGNLSLRLRDLATIGNLVLNGGVHEARRIVSQEWIDASFEPHVQIRGAAHYGYMWYTIKPRPAPDPTVTYHGAVGNGGNRIYIAPTLRMVVAITSSAYNRREYMSQRSGHIWRRTLAALAAGPQ